MLSIGRQGSLGSPGDHAQLLLHACRLETLAALRGRPEFMHECQFRQPKQITVFHEDTLQFRVQSPGQTNETVELCGVDVAGIESDDNTAALLCVVRVHDPASPSPRTRALKTHIRSEYSINLSSTLPLILSSGKRPCASLSPAAIPVSSSIP